MRVSSMNEINPAKPAMVKLIPLGFLERVEDILMKTDEEKLEHVLCYQKIHEPLF